MALWKTTGNFTTTNMGFHSTGKFSIFLHSEKSEHLKGYSDIIVNFSFVYILNTYNFCLCMLIWLIFFLFFIFICDKIEFKQTLSNLNLAKFGVLIILKKRKSKN